MIHSTDIKKFARKVFKGQKRPKNPELMHPNREWVIGLIIVLMIFIGAAVWSAQTYLEYREVSISDGQFEQETVVVYRESIVDAALEIFSERESALTSLLSNVPEIIPEPVSVVEESVATSTQSGEEEGGDELDIDDESSAEILASTTADSLE